MPSACIDLFRRMYTGDRRFESSARRDYYILFPEGEQNMDVATRVFNVSWFDNMALLKLGAPFLLKPHIMELTLEFAQTLAEYNGWEMPMRKKKEPTAKKIHKIKRNDKKGNRR